MQSEKYKINWHTYSDHLREMLQDMLKIYKFTDVTLVCDDQIQFKAHKLVLSACSEFFQRIIRDIPQQESVIYLRGIQHQEMESILEFMYQGKATVYKSRMDEFLKVANDLEVKEISNGVPMENFQAADNEIKIEIKNEELHKDEEHNTTLVEPSIILKENTQEEKVTIKKKTKVINSQSPLYLVSTDLQNLIITSNPEKNIKFTLSQRSNTQMVIDNYLLKKKKGPFLSGGRMAINWKCVKDSCQYSMLTKDGQIMDTPRPHNHDAEPELYLHREARAKIKESIAKDASLSEDTSAANAVKKVKDVVNEANEEEKKMMGNVDAHKQAARRFKRKLLGKETKLDSVSLAGEALK